ncbi:hypothetical protein [Candidatus Lokiarchaeum ossiferum]|uniref:hypothetical protein n=1 Tax=Candidatus Lokiarchaeum ossiferum TaxID=2951803 RepID=UPI00352F92B0
MMLQWIIFIIVFCQICALGCLVYYLFQFARKWELRFYRKAATIFIYVGITIVFRLVVMLSVKEKLEAAHIWLIIANLLFHIPIFLFIWLELSSCYNHLSRLHLLLGLFFGARITLSLIPSMTFLEEIQTTSMFYLSPLELVPKYFSVLFFIPFIDLLMRIAIKSQKTYISRNQTFLYRRVFFYFGLYLTVALISIFVSVFWNVILNEISVLIFFIGLFSLSKKYFSFFILNVIYLKKPFIMKKSLTRLPLAKLDFEDQTEGIDNEIVSTFKQFLSSYNTLKSIL